MQETELKHLVLRISRECLDSTTGLVNFDAMNSVLPSGLDLETLETIIQALYESGLLLSEVAQEPLEEGAQDSETDLSNALAAYIYEITRLPVLSADELHHLLQNLDQFGERGRQRVVNHYLHMVLDQARSRGGKRELILERIQEGNLALMKAVKAYRPDGRREFRDLARWHIQKAMVKVERTMQQRMELPDKLIQFFKEFKVVGDRLNQRLNRRPDIEEVARELQMDPEIVRANLALAGNVAHSESATDEDDAAFVRHVRDVTGNRGLNPSRLSALKTVLKENLDKVSPIEQEILTLYYDLEETGQELDFVEIADSLGIKTKLVADFETAAMTKIMQGPAN